MRTPPEPYIGGRSGPSWLEGWAHIIARESSAAPKVYRYMYMRHAEFLTSALVQTHGASSRRPRRCSGGPLRWPSRRPKSLHGAQWRPNKRAQQPGASRIAQKTKPSPTTATARTQPQLLTFMGAWLVACPPTNVLTSRTPIAHSSVANIIPEAAPLSPIQAQTLTVPTPQL